MKRIVIGICIVTTLITGVVISSLFDGKEQLINSDIFVQKNVEDTKNKQIYSTISTQNYWAYDVYDTEQVFERADYVIKAKIIEIEASNYDNSSSTTPTTPILIETLEILKGDRNTDIKHILKWGGYVTIKQVIGNVPNDRIDKWELNQLTEEQQNSLYMYYEPDGNYDLEAGKTYVIALRYVDGNYYMTANGYDIFEVNDNDISPLSDNTPKTYKNVLTGNELVIE